jgi:hypothetical protein
MKFKLAKVFRNFSKVCGRVYEVYRNMRLWPMEWYGMAWHGPFLALYVLRCVLLRIRTMPEIWNRSVKVPSRILVNSVKRFVGQRKSPPMALCKPSLFMDHNVWDLEFVWQLPWQFCRAYEWLCTGIGLVIGFIELLQTVTTRNYSAIASSHTLQYYSTY